MNLLAAFGILVTLAYYSLGGAQLLMFEIRALGDAQIGRYENIASRQAQSVLTSELVTAEQAAITAGKPYQPIGTLAAMPSTPLCDAAAPCGYSVSATFATDGETDGTQGSPTVVAPNVESVAGITERRLAVTMTVNVLETSTGNIVHARPQRVKFRLWAPNNAEAEEDQDGGARLNRVASGASENEGCATDGTGCDPNAVATPDPTTIDGTQQCVDGAGSGTCSPGETKPDAQKTNIPWANPQSSASGTSGP